MGLCKCRVVTNLFCFDHRANVCENCLVQEHPKVCACAGGVGGCIWCVSMHLVGYMCLMHVHVGLVYMFVRYIGLTHAILLPHISSMLTQHTPNLQQKKQCIIRSYLQWLQDSDYVSACTLCQMPLQQGDTIRLICYGMWVPDVYVLVCSYRLYVQ